MNQTSDLLNEKHYPEWDLSSLYTHPNDPQMIKDWDTLAHDVAFFKEKFQGVFASEHWLSDDLFDAIRQFEKISERMGRISAYTGLRYYKNAQDPEIIQQFQQARERLTNLSSDLIFFELEMNAIADDTLQSALNDHKDLNHYAPYLKQVRLQRPYQLPEEIEHVLHEKSITSNAALVRLYDETLADMTFDFDGTMQQLSYLTNQMSHENPEIRKKAAISLSNGLNEKQKIFTFITNTLAKDKQIEDKLRGFETPMHARHIANQTEPEVVDALVSTVKAHYPRLSHRYYALKAKLLGMPKLNYWDRNAPLPFVEDKKYTWLETKDIVLEAYQDFCPQMATIAKRFFDNHWIDVPTTPGKNDGAFSHPTVPSANPFILLNFQQTKRDVMTLAHELGHGIHQILAAKQGYFMSDTPLTLAETASVFGEMLTFQSLLKKTTNTKERITLLAGKIDDMINTVVRQIAFYQFESIVHSKRKEKELSSDELAAIWLETQAEALGSSVHLDPLVGNYWSYISHFIHSPFYVYAYAFGDCLVNSLFAVFQKEPNGFVDKYLNMLAAGGTLGHKDMLAPFGLNAHQPDFWENGLRMIENMIDELDQLAVGI